MTSVILPSSIGGDDQTYSDDANVSTGLRNGGFRTRLILLFANLISMVTFAKTQATNAATSATNAAASATAVAAAGSVSALVNGTSSTSITVGNGSKTFTTQSGKSWVVGMRLRISDTATGANVMEGNVTAYSGTSLTVNVTYTEGSGTITTWAISQCGAKGAASLTNFTESRSAAGVNATVPASKLTPTTGANEDFVAGPTGTGALLAQMPDGTATGGDKRGANAVDHQQVRSAAAQVASGANATIGGGLNNKANGAQATVGGGTSNVASGQAATVAGGSTNTASGIGATVRGGNSNSAAGNYSEAAGLAATDRGINGSEAWAGAGGAAAGLGKTQTMRLVLGASTTDATVTVLTTDGVGAASAANQITLPNNSAYYCLVRVIGYDYSNNKAKCWYSDDVLIRRGANAASTALVGTPTVTAKQGDASLAGASIALSADTTLGALKIAVTPIAATNMRWCAQVTTVDATA